MPLKKITTLKTEIIAFIIFSIILIYITLYTSGHSFDEFIFLEGAKRILAGQMPYKNFYGFITPGLYYLIALVWKIFGQQYIYVRILTIMMSLAISIVIYLLYKNFINKYLALLGSLYFILILLPLELNLYHHWLALLSVLITNYFSLKYIDSKNNKSLLWAGLSLGLGFLFFHAKIAYVYIGQIIFFIFYEYKNNPLKKIFIFSSAFALPVVLVMGYFLLQAGLKNVWTDLIVSNLVYYPKQNYIPLKTNIFFVSSLMSWLIISIYLLKHSLLKNKKILLLYINSLAMFAASLYRLDQQHQAYILPAFYILFAFYITTRLNYKKISSQLMLTILLIPLATNIYNNPIKYYLDRSQWEKFENTDLGDLYLAKNRSLYTKPVIATINSLASDKIFIYPQLPLYYSLLDIPNPSRFFMIDNRSMSENDKNSLKNDLIEKNIQYIIYNPAERPYYPSSNLIPWIEENFPYKQIIHYPQTDRQFYLYSKENFN